jgi:hypothetical protein
MIWKRLNYVNLYFSWIEKDGFLKEMKRR